MSRSRKPENKRTEVAVHTFLSLRDRLTGAVVELLEHEHMACTKTQDGLVLLINALASYHEEGRALFPEVFIIDDLKSVLSVLPGSQNVAIGAGPKEAPTMAKALKQCAPLAQDGWALYITREKKAFSYGVFRCGAIMLSLSIADLLIHAGDSLVPALMIRQVAHSVVEVKGVLQTSLLVHFGATKESEIPPFEAVRAFASSITVDVPEKIREQASGFYQRLFAKVLQAGHGTLAAVMSDKRRTLPPSMRDGIRLHGPIPVTDFISELLLKGDNESNTRLKSTAALISGMLLSDGITLFGTDGSVRAFNIFIKHAPVAGEGKPKFGGARRRTFDTLGSLIGTSLTAVFMQSQDGRVEYR